MEHDLKCSRVPQTLAVAPVNRTAEKSLSTVIVDAKSFVCISKSAVKDFCLVYEISLFYNLHFWLYFFFVKPESILLRIVLF